MKLKSAAPPTTFNKPGGEARSKAPTPSTEKHRRLTVEICQCLNTVNVITDCTCWAMVLATETSKIIAPGHDQRCSGAPSSSQHESPAPRPRELLLRQTDVLSRTRVLCGDRCQAGTAHVLLSSLKGLRRYLSKLLANSTRTTRCPRRSRLRACDSPLPRTTVGFLRAESLRVVSMRTSELPRCLVHWVTITPIVSGFELARLRVPQFQFESDAFSTLRLQTVARKPKHLNQ